MDRKTQKIIKIAKKVGLFVPYLGAPGGYWRICPILIVTRLRCAAQFIHVGRFIFSTSSITRKPGRIHIGWIETK